MPRAKKTMSGAPGQGVQAIQGQTYGEGVAQERLQQAMPAPNVRAPQPAPQQTQTSPAPMNAGPAQVQRPRMSIEEVQKMVSGLGGTLNAPDDRPSAPFTTGLQSGPSPSISLPTSSRQFKTLETFRQLTVATGDPIFSELASKMGL